MSDAPPGSASERARVGEVWTFWTPTSDQYAVGAVLKAAESELLIVPVLMDTTWAAEADLFLAAEVLGYGAVAAIWAGDRVLVEQAVERVAVLPPEHLRLVLAAHKAQLAERRIQGPVGPPVLGEQDPRINAHAAIVDDLRQLYEPWAVLHAADELGPVAARRRAELGLGADELDVEPAIWRAFEEGRADPQAHIPAKDMARAVRRLGLVASRRLLELARASVLAHHQGGGPAVGRAFARRRQGAPRQAAPDPEAARFAADRYAVALTRELNL